jgi:hypothetical protein
MRDEIYRRYKDYDEDYCWQYDKRIKNLEEDLEIANLTEEKVSELRTSDFEFSFIPSGDKKQCEEVVKFIERNEWLESMPNRPTHRFVCRLKGSGIMAGTVVMAIPNSFSNILGKENKDKEALISRGACISWAPKNLGSWLITKATQWMVENTEFRFFTAYSDPEAKELGTIYQACNFYYLGSNFGSKFLYFDVERKRKEDRIDRIERNHGITGKSKKRKSKQGWFSEREFRKKSNYAKYAKRIHPKFYEAIGFHDFETKMFGFISWRKSQGFYKKEKGVKRLKNISWDDATELREDGEITVRRVRRHTALRWMPNWGFLKKEYPVLVIRLAEELEKYKDSCDCRPADPKHKYVLILGKTKGDTKYLRREFFRRNPKLKGKEFNYPTERGK